ncbi:hypothetical protein QUF55_08335, partial [Clostridiaceae bacterium HSG29]|nr:hypothetical protein [Clostridiaceae bacterium HSG29]
KKKRNKELFKKDITPSKTKTEQKKEMQLKKDEQKKIKKMKKRMEKILEEIEALEKNLHSNENSLCKEEIYSNGAEVKRINNENLELEKNINQLYEELSDLDVFLENI